MQVIVAIITAYKEEPMVRVYEDRETALARLSEEFLPPFANEDEQVCAKTVEELNNLNGYFEFTLELQEVIKKRNAP